MLAISSEDKVLISLIGVIVYLHLMSNPFDIVSVGGLPMPQLTL